MFLLLAAALVVSLPFRMVRQDDPQALEKLSTLRYIMLRH